MRDKINEGINQAQYFLLVLSQYSIDAPWVKMELDSAMIKELENNRMVVIPIMLGTATNSQIPPDLKGKLYIDFRKQREYAKNFENLIRVFDLKKKERKKYLNQIRKGLENNSFSIEQLISLANEGRDQMVQCAALTGLLASESQPKALIGIAQRLLNPWGVNTIRHTIKCLTKLSEVYGLILLSATLFLDDRFISEKLKAMSKILINNGYLHFATDLDNLGNIEEIKINPQKVNKWSNKLKRIKHPAIRQGSIFGSRYVGTVGFQSHALKVCPPKETIAACKYVESSVPGLANLFSNTLKIKDSTWSTTNESEKIPYNDLGLPFLQFKRELIERTIIDAVQAEMEAYYNLPLINLRKLKLCFDENGSAYKIIVDRLYKNQKRNWNLKNPLNPSTYRILDIKLLDFNEEQAEIKTKEYFHLLWWSDNTQKYEMQNRREQSSNYLLRWATDKWLVVENYSSPPRKLTRNYM